MPMSHTGAPNFERHIRNIERRVKNPTPMWRKVGSYWSSAVRRNFATEGAYMGHPWRPLKPDYAIWKVRHGYGGKILVQSGAMRASFTSRPMSVERYNGQSAVFGSSDQKAIWHHYGTHRGGKQVNPPRPIMVVNAKTRGDVRQIMKAYVLGKNTSIRGLL